MGGVNPTIQLAAALDRRGVTVSLDGERVLVHLGTYRKYIVVEPRSDAVPVAEWPSLVLALCRARGMQPPERRLRGCGRRDREIPARHPRTRRYPPAVPDESHGMDLLAGNRGNTRTRAGQARVRRRRNLALGRKIRCEREPAEGKGTCACLRRESVPRARRPAYRPITKARCAHHASGTC